MKSVQMWTAAAAVIAVRLAAQMPPALLWAVSDGVGVNPVTAQVFEERADIHTDYPAGGLRAANSVWTGPRRRPFR
jgi:hypothetical protein